MYSAIQKKWLHSYNGKTVDVCKYYWEGDMVYAYELLGKLKNPKNYNIYEHVYIFENLTESEMTLIHLAIDSQKIFTCEFLGGSVLPSMRKNLLTIMKVMEAANSAHVCDIWPRPTAVHKTSCSYRPPSSPFS
jgi:hypothetical protein